MDADNILFKLGDAAGIEPFYWDMHGTRHETTPETMRGLLKAFGIAAEDDGQVWSSLARLGEEVWRSPLPPVVVACGGETASIPVRLPTHGSDRAVRWSLKLEQGGERAGEFRLSELAVEETGHIGEMQIALRHLKLDALPLGYHDFVLENEAGTGTRLIVAPPRAYLPPALENRRAWGIMLQLYSLKSRGDWGVGDFGDLKILIDAIAGTGADAIGLNPMHTLFLDQPEDASPYSPCSRLFRNPLYLDITAIPDFAECDAVRALLHDGQFAHAVEQVRDAELVQYRAVARFKLPALERLHESFVANHLAHDDDRARAFRRYVSEGGRDLEGLATFQALAEHCETHDWSRWPARHRDPDSKATAQFRKRFADRIGFHQYLQWQCEEQFRSASELAKSRGMAVGLYNDLAVSVDSSSADHWAHQKLFAGGARVGAPPDPFNEKGQDWGVVPLNPLRLRGTAYAHFRSLLRANMRHAGALRIDHVMGWQRLFLIPPGGTPAAGAYVRYPVGDMVAVACLESTRHRCLVVGEDLGTVPAGFRERMTGAGVLSSRVLYFERRNEAFKPPREYPSLAAVSVSTHDLATLHGFWEGRDIAAKAHLGLFQSAAEEEQIRAGRVTDKRQLLAALAEQGLLPDGLSPQDADHLAFTPQLAAAVHAYLARSSSMLFMVQMDDLTGQAQQANLPGSVTEYPNWRRRLVRPLEEAMADPAMRDAMGAIAADRAK
ncbi:MAG TPA: 4-alpha-glucanotransferase [Rhizomicrobium sp.]|nr:4-alpha-glucanotransferase [Rhizomicrobium sp.]